MGELPLRFMTCLGSVSDGVGEAIARYVGARCGIETDFFDGGSWRDRQARFDDGTADVSWLCGLSYVLRSDLEGQDLEILAAPVPAGSRYGGQPVHFTDVVVRRDSDFRRFLDLRGRRWAYTEPRSQSGFNVVRFYLSVVGETNGFFGEAVEAGSDEEALRLLLEGEVDGTGIDSIVLDHLIPEAPELESRIRTVETMGPSPVSPWVIRKSVDPTIRERVRETLLAMDGDEEGRDVLEHCRLIGFVPMPDHQYNLVRTMRERAETVRLTAGEA